jgi:dTDP-glucose 4,6-dehydratase
MALDRLLVTGAAGFIGSNFAHYWHRHYPQSQLIILDALTYAGNRANLTDLLAHPQVDLVGFYHRFGHGVGQAISKR